MKLYPHDVELKVGLRITVNGHAKFTVTKISEDRVDMKANDGEEWFIDVHSMTYLTDDTDEQFATAVSSIESR